MAANSSASSRSSVKFALILPCNLVVLVFEDSPCQIHVKKCPCSHYVKQEEPPTLLDPFKCPQITSSPQSSEFSPLYGNGDVKSEVIDLQSPILAITHKQNHLFVLLDKGVVLAYETQIQKLVTFSALFFILSINFDFLRAKSKVIGVTAPRL